MAEGLDYLQMESGENPPPGQIGVDLPDRPPARGCGDPANDEMGGNRPEQASKQFKSEADFRDLDDEDGPISTCWDPSHLKDKSIDDIASGPIEPCEVEPDVADTVENKPHQKLVGIRFKPTGKIYHFDPGAFVLNSGDTVVVETKQGFGLGTVASPPETTDTHGKIRELKKVYRLANEQDLIQVQKNSELEKTAHAYCLSCIKTLDLKMHLFSVESAFDGTKLTFFFTADGRVDFRQLVKMLVQKLCVRVEMRQVGIRHQAKICGGIGRCGRQICCSTFIEQFDPVSIRMAKEQNLSLNPTKISGQCGRLMCCLIFEYHTYKELRKQFPKIGKTVQTAQGKGRVVRHNTIGNRVTVRLEDKSEIEVDLESIPKEP